MINILFNIWINNKINISLPPIERLFFCVENRKLKLSVYKWNVKITIKTKLPYILNVHNKSDICDAYRLKKHKNTAGRLKNKKMIF